MPMWLSGNKRGWKCVTRAYAQHSPPPLHTSSALEGPSTSVAQVGNEEWVCVTCEASKGCCGTIC